MFGEEMSRLQESDDDLNGGDFEDNNSSTDGEESPDLDSGEEQANPKDYRDIAEGKNLNNSFVGPYPENWDHLHIDKGPNPQFLIFNEVPTTLNSARNARV